MADSFRETHFVFEIARRPVEGLAVILSSLAARPLTNFRFESFEIAHSLAGTPGRGEGGI